eukprot:gene12186-5773_t
MSKRKHEDFKATEEEEEGDYAEVEDEDEEDDEDFDDDEPSKKKSKYSEFLDIEAGVDNDDEDEDEGDSDLEDFIEQDSKDSSKPRIEVKRVQIPSKGKEKRNEAFMQELEARYASREVGPDDEDIDEDEEDEFYEDYESVGGRKTGIRQQQQYPTATDPKLFMVKCKHGKEREAVVTILQKSFDLARTKPLLIHSAVALDTLKGVIYIEAYKEAHVKDAINGIKTIFEGGIKLVPTKEMSEILTIQDKGIEIKKGDWVKIKRGVYKGDVGQVFEVDETRAEATIKLIPRLEHGEKRERRKGLFRAEDFERNGKTLVSKQNDFSIYDGKRFKDGFLYKVQKFNTLETKNVAPSLDELNVFQAGTTSQDTITTQNFGQKKKVSFSKGDEVVVIEGDAKHLRGTVYEISKDKQTVTIIPRHDELKDPLKFPHYQLQKHFELGDFCKVVSGKHEGSTGHIVNVDRDTVVLYSDVLVKELEVFTRDIRKTTELSSTEASIGDYSLHDLVKLDSSTAGVIVKMEKDAFKVLDNNGIIQTITLKEMGSKFSQRSSNYKTSDKNNNFVGASETIKVLEGPHAGRTGIVKHIYRSILFCHARDLLENSGIFVIRAKSVELVGAKKNLTGPPQSRASNFKAKKFRHPDQNKVVKIIKGVYKGYVGTIKEANESVAQVILQSKFKTIKVPIGGYEIVSQEEKAPTRSRLPTTPWDISRTKTPLRDSAQTPSHYDGLRTPNPNDYPETPRTPNPNDPWNPNKPNTPFNDRPTTPSSARTPFSTFPSSKSVQTPMSSYSSISTPGTSYSSINTPMSSYSSINTPGTSSYSSIDTPGGTYSSMPVNTPGVSSYSNVPINTPGTSSYSSIQTPGTSSYSSIQTPVTSSYSSIQTPGFSSINTPSGSYSSVTPSYTPMNIQTPGVNYSSSYSSIQTPIGSYGGNYNTPNYGPNSPMVSSSEKEIPIDSGIEIEITQGQYSGLKGCVKNAISDQATIIISDGNEQKLVDVPLTALKLTVPKKKDKVKIIEGEHKGTIGALMGMEDNEGMGIVKSTKDGKSDIVIINLSYIAKLMDQN